MRFLVFTILFVCISCSSETSKFNYLLEIYEGQCFSKNTYLDSSNGQQIVESDTSKIHELEITNIDLSELNNNYTMTIYCPETMDEDIYHIRKDRIELDSIIGNSDLNSMRYTESILLDRINNTLEIKYSRTNAPSFGGFTSNCLYTIKE